MEMETMPGGWGFLLSDLLLPAARCGWLGRDRVRVLPVRAVVSVFQCFGCRLTKPNLIPSRPWNRKDQNAPGAMPKC